MLRIRIIGIQHHVQHYFSYILWAVVYWWRKLELWKESLNSNGQQFHQYQQDEQSPLNSDGQQFHQYQQNEQSPLNSDGQQFHQYRQNEQSPLNSDGQQFH